MRRTFPLLLVLLAVGCSDDESVPAEDTSDTSTAPDATDDAVESDTTRDDAVADSDTGSPPDAASLDPSVPLAFEFSPSAPAVPRLTSQQYVNAVRDLFGPTIVVSSTIEPDVEVGGLYQVGSAAATISPRGVERYEQSAFDIASQVFRADDALERLPCAPAGVRDDDCASTVLGDIARRAYRRPLDAEDLERLTEIAGRAAEVTDSFLGGLEFGTAAILQSPHFLFRVELGAPDEAREGIRLYDDYEMASRLSFFLWNTIPDETLFAAAERGELTTDAGLYAQATRLLDDERARAGVMVFFEELYGLHDLLDLVKDPTVFPAMSPDLGPAAREETLLALEHLVFDLDGDFREILTTRRTFVDRRLAALYGVRAPAREGFGETVLPEDGPRAGLLGHASLMALYAHSTATSATRRGQFVRQVMLCGEIPPPPSGVDTSIPEAIVGAATLRDRVARHLEADECAGCHALMDPIGLAFENFDGLGAWRTLDNDELIDPSGDLDGQPFSTAVELSALIHDDPRFADCLVERLYRYATSTVEGWEQADGLTPLKMVFEASGYRVRSLILHLIMSPAFRQTGEIE